MNTLKAVAPTLSFFFICFLHPAVSNAIGHSIDSAKNGTQLDQNKLIHYDLPGQNLADSLLEFALQSGITVIVDDNLIKNYRSSPVIGACDTKRAAENLLANTPLSVRYIANSKTMVIIPKAPANRDEVASTIDREVSSDKLVEEILVKGVSYPFRYNTIASSQLHSGISTFDSARFLSVLPEQLAVDQQSLEVTDLLRNSSSITPADGLADSNDDFYVRGFPRHALYVDGFRLDNTTGTKIPTALIERVEILKGPSTLLYGQAEPGGVVNVVRKKPVGKRHRRIVLTGGSGGKRRIDLDLNGSVNDKAKNLLYRLIYTNEKQDFLRDITDVDRESISPSFSWSASENTFVDIGFDYQKSSQRRDQGSIILTPDAGEVNIISIDSPPHQKRPDFSSRYRLFNTTLSHYFADTWSLQAKYFKHREDRKGVRASRDTLLTTDILFEAGDLEPDQQVVPIGFIPIPIDIGTEISNGENEVSVASLRSLYDEQGRVDAQFLSFAFEGSPAYRGLTHHITLGADWHKQDHEEAFIVEDRTDIESLSLDGAQLTNALDIAQAIVNNNPELGTLTYRSQRLRYNDYGLYFHDSIELNQQWLASFGGRYTLTEGERENHQANTKMGLETFNELSSQLGLVYKPVQDISLYLNYSEAMKANYQLDDIGTPISEPELSQQFELGAKTNLFNGQLISTFSLFDIEKENIVNVKFVDGLRNAVADERQKIRGLDMDFTYQASQNIDIIGGFSYLDPKIASGENRGNIPTLSSEKTASLFLNYRFSKGPLSGLSANIGTYYVGKRFGDDENTFSIDAYSTVDIGAAYKFQLGSGNYTVQMNIKNLFDKEYYSAVEGGIRTNIGSGRLVLLSLKMAM